MTTSELLADPDPWEQEAGEATAAFQAFRIYRDQPGNRSRRKVAEAVDKAESLIGRWMVRWRWIERVRYYDAHVDRMARDAHEKQILDFRARAATQARGKAQSLMIPDMVISARIEAARAKGEDLLAMFEGVSIADLVTMAIHGGRVLPALLKAEGEALGKVPDQPISAEAAPDVLTQRIQASDELRGLLAVVVERASVTPSDTPGGVCDLEEMDSNERTIRSKTAIHPQ